MSSRQLPLLPLLYVVSVVCLCVGGSAVRDRARPWLDALKETKRYTESEENYTAEKKKKKRLNENVQQKNAKWGEGEPL